jgi:hypothetical protein
MRCCLSLRLEPTEKPGETGFDLPARLDILSIQISNFKMMCRTSRGDLPRIVGFAGVDMTSLCAFYAFFIDRLLE